MCSSCGSYNQYCTHQQGAPSFSYWPNSTHYQNPSYSNNYNDDQDYSSSFASSPNSVDCTLSLGTPSTRFSTSENHTHYETMSSSKPTPHRNSVSSFCWDLLHPNKQQPSSKSHRHHSNGGSSGGDPLLARRCANCDTTSTPLWRNGPRGPKVNILIIILPLLSINY